MALGGRPKEEGGHKPFKLSFDKFTSQALEKIREGNGNISGFVESELSPVLKQLDPGESSIHIWRIEQYLAGRIIDAASNGEFETVKALGSIGNALKDYRKLAGIPPSDSEIQQSAYAQYSDMEPMRALKVARIDWVLSNVNWNSMSLYGENELEQFANYLKYGQQTQAVKYSLELIRDLLVREGKALGRDYKPSQ